MQRSTSADSTVRFAGLTSHNNADMTDKAASIAGINADDPPDTSMVTAIRDLETADSGQLSWRLPEQVAKKVDVHLINSRTPDGVEAHRVDAETVYVDTSRFHSVYSPDKLTQWASAARDDDDPNLPDALWHVPTKTYSIVNPVTAYEPLEKAIREEDYGDDVFGEIRQYKGGGEVHMDVMFDAFQIDYNDDDEGRDPIVVGVRTGYDFFGSQALYFEGFAQDTRCSNSIRAITEKKTIRHVGDVNLEEQVQSVLEEMQLMTNRLAELIELAQDIEVDMLEMEFAEPFDHTDNYRGLYELVGFPSYLAKRAANHARHRADNQFLPSMTALWDGATFAMTHHYSGGENTTRARELIDASNDFVMNPAMVLGEVTRNHRMRLEAQAEEGDDDLVAESSHATIERFEQSVQDQADEFESRNEELRATLLAEANGETEDAE